MTEEIFRSVVGASPHDYLTKLRMLRASDLLNDPALTVTYIAEQVGYASDNAFARAFKGEVGVTPSEYKRDNRQRRHQ